MIRTRATSSTITPRTILILGKRSLFKKPVFLFISLTSESIGSKFSDIIVLLFSIHSIREKEIFSIYRFVRYGFAKKITPIYGGINDAYPHP
jgi:hypothetical protein